MLGGPAQALLDVLRLINTLAALRAPRSAPPLVRGWVHGSGQPMPAMHPRSTVMRGIADLWLVPGWHAQDGPDLDLWWAAPHHLPNGRHKRWPRSNLWGTATRTLASGAGAPAATPNPTRIGLVGFRV